MTPAERRALTLAEYRAFVAFMDDYAQALEDR